MKVTEYYKVTVSIEEDTGIVNKQGEPKIKKSRETYLVTNCGSPQEAADRVEKEFEHCMDEWSIVSVKAEKLDDILDAKKD
jgi:hypothetical protein